MKGHKGFGEIATAGKEKVQHYNAQGSEAEKEADDEKDGFKRGGKPKKKFSHGGKAEGKEPKKRLDRKSRASGGRSPYTTAGKDSGGVAEDNDHGKEENGPGAEVEIPVYRRGGKAKK